MGRWRTGIAGGISIFYKPPASTPSVSSISVTAVLLLSLQITIQGEPAVKVNEELAVPL
jgi:hypothetical protein